MGILSESREENKIEKSRKKERDVNRRRTGADYEQAAGYYLQQMGYEILKYNYRCPAGEIDLIAKDGPYLVFCEVKYRSGPKGGKPLEAVDARKQRKLMQCAAWYMAGREDGGIPCRFDAIGIDGTRVTHIKDAFSG